MTSQIVVLDVSGIGEILFHREKCELFASIVADAQTVLSPELYIAELTNMIWKYHKAKILTPAECRKKAEEGLMAVNNFVAMSSLWKDAMDAAMQYAHPAYDLYYAVLTQKHHGLLVTKDGSLAKICKEMNIDCVI
jgi:predicted nucleic acid-binding protein